jgi:hypothetical protein
MNAHARRKHRQDVIQIKARVVPLDNRVNCERMPQVVQSWLVRTVSSLDATDLSATIESLTKNSISASTESTEQWEQGLALPESKYRSTF